MLVYNEGVPGAGKTYDSIVEHLLPALKRGRTVFARINGLNFEVIAELCEMELADVQRLLLPLSSEEVLPALQAVRDEAGEFVIPDKFHNALVLVDEAHEFYVASREALGKEVEQFFAIHRHYGMDIVLMTQWYKRLHTAIRARIERKNVFQKLTAVGLKGSYRVTFWQTVSPDKYEKVGGATRKYVAKYFPAYKGLAGDGMQAEVYEGGSRTVWATLLPGTIAVGVMVTIAVIVLLRFFGGDSGLVPEEKPPAQAVTGKVYQQPVDAPLQAVGVPAVKPVVKEVTDGMTPEQAYVWKLVKSARVRVSGVVGEGSAAWGIIEFREKNQPPLEVLDTRKLEAMGIGVERKDYGFV